MNAEILQNDVISYKNWECNQKATVTHLVNTAAPHTLKFDFGGEINYAYNAPGSTTYTFTGVTQSTDDYFAYEDYGVEIFTGPDDNGTSEATNTDYDNIEADDGNRWTTAGANADSEYDSQLYKFYIDETEADVSQFDLKWNGYGETKTDYNTYFYIWDYNSSVWEQVDSNDFTTATDVDLTGLIDTNLTNYIDNDNEVALMTKTKKYDEGDDPGQPIFCPFFYSWDGSKYLFDNTIIYKLDSKEKEKLQYRDLYYLSTQGKTKALIKEEEYETSYIDQIYLEIIDYKGSYSNKSLLKPKFSTRDLEQLLYSDDKYLKTEYGDEIYLEFENAPVLKDGFKRKIRIAAEGYYINYWPVDNPFVFHQKKHNSLYTDYVELEVTYKKDNGESCETGSDCSSGNCIDSYCCDTACDGNCEACDISGSEGTCTYISSGTDPDGDCDGCANDCAAETTCDGSGNCQTSSCSSQEACQNGSCSGSNYCFNGGKAYCSCEGDNCFEDGGFDYICQAQCDSSGTCDYAANCTSAENEKNRLQFSGDINMENFDLSHEIPESCPGSDLDDCVQTECGTTASGECCTDCEGTSCDQMSVYTTCETCNCWCDTGETAVYCGSAESDPIAP